MIREAARPFPNLQSGPWYPLAFRLEENRVRVRPILSRAEAKQNHKSYNTSPPDRPLHNSDKTTRVPPSNESLDCRSARACCAAMTATLDQRRSSRPWRRQLWNGLVARHWTTNRHSRESQARVETHALSSRQTPKKVEATVNSSSQYCLTGMFERSERIGISNRCKYPRG